MADPQGSTRDAVIKRFAEEPWKFDYYQLMRLVEAMWPDQPRLGTAVRAGAAPVRIGQEPTVAFAPSPVASVDWRPAETDEGLGAVDGEGGADPGLEIDMASPEARRAPGAKGQLDIAVHAFGLLGPNGPMPLHVTEFVRDREFNHRDTTMRSFLDMFHHRMSCLLYRAWASSRSTVSRDRPWDDPFGRYMGSLVGIGMDPFEERDSTTDDAKRFHAGSIAKAARGPVGLETVLRDQFSAPVRVEEFIGRWIRVPDESQTRLGADPGSGMLGETVFVGERFWDCQQTFRLVIGPIGLADFEAFLPGTPGMRRLRDWVRLYTGRLLRCEAQLVLKKEEVPPMQLSGDGSSGGAQLCWTTWLRASEAEEDAGEAVFIVEP